MVCDISHILGTSSMYQRTAGHNYWLEGSIYAAQSYPGTITIVYVLGQSPHNWRTTMDWNVVPIIFHTQNICHHRGKLSELHYDVLLFSNRREKVGKTRKTRGQICPIVCIPFMTFSPRLEKNNMYQCSSDSFPCIVTYFLCVKNCQIYIFMHSCLPIAGRLFYNVRKFYVTRIWECNIWMSAFNIK